MRWSKLEEPEIKFIHGTSTNASLFEIAETGDQTKLTKSTLLSEDEVVMKDKEADLPFVYK